MKKFGRALKGFTLVEVLIVIVIVGILIAALLPRLTGAQSRARDMARKGHLNQVATSVGIWLQDNGSLSGQTFDANDASLSLTDYLTSIPTDPTNQTLPVTGAAAGQYVIVPLTRSSTGDSFAVVSQVENEGLANWSGSLPSTNASFSAARTQLCEQPNCPDGATYYVIIQ
jgi:prepilin-type N-terminal cleavage/methylation domain-containing protein